MYPYLNAAIEEQTFLGVRARKEYTKNVELQNNLKSILKAYTSNEYGRRHKK